MQTVFKNWIIIVTVVFCSYNFTVLAETATFNTVTEALNYNGNRATVTKLIITGTISGNDYSTSSEWSKFRTFNKIFPNIEEVEILTDQDIPDYDKTNQSTLFFRYYNNNLETANWLKNFSAPNVKKIGSRAFSYCSNLISVNFHFPLVTNIGEYAFSECLNLTSVNFPLAINIGEGAFSDCENLASVNFPLVTYIGPYAFTCCSKLTTINFPLATNIGNGAFYNCLKLTSINFPLVTNIERWAFRDCSNLTSVNFPLATNIGEWAFIDCSNLTSIDFPLATNIEKLAFNGCKNLVSATFGIGFETTTEIKFGEKVFTYSETQDVDLILGENVLPEPDLDKKIWQDDSGNGRGNPYYWKSITKFSGIEEIIKNSTVSIYPNPTVGNATVSFELEKSCNMKILLCDILGIELMNVYDGFASEGNFIKTINIGHLSKGVYFLKVLIGGNFTVEKIVIE